MRALRLVALAGTLSLLPLSPAVAAAPSVDRVRAEADWILSTQLPDGAIAHSTDRLAVWPYLGSFATMGLARAAEVTGNRSYTDAAWRWLAWYQAHQGPEGFVTDYVMDGGVLRSTGDMDSTDSYAGMFLLAARRTWKATGDVTKLGTLRVGIEGAVRAIEATQDVDGLTWAKPAWRVKYAMDQAETYAGLRAAADLARALSDPALAGRADADADRLAAGFATLWNADRGAYDWAVHGDGRREATNWSVLYPDALEQVWPVAFGLVTGPRAQQMMARFQAAQPSWDQPAAMATIGATRAPGGYWPVAGWAFAAIGQKGRAQLAADRIGGAAAADARRWPFTTGIAGEMIQLVSSDPLR